MNSVLKRIMIGLLSVGVVVFLSLALFPVIEADQLITKQLELIESIEEGDGTIVLNGYDEAVDDLDSPPLKNLMHGFIDLVLDLLESEVTSLVPDIDFSENSVNDDFSIINEEREHEHVNTGSSDVITGIGILEISRIGVKVPVTEGISDKLLKVAVCHVSETPMIGELGNAVVAGHRSATYSRYFNRLNEVLIGDIVSYVAKDGKKMDFIVFDILEVLPDSAVVFEPFTDRRVITLLTCTPIGVATHRLLVRAELLFD